MRFLRGACFLAVPFLLRSPAAAANKDPAPLLDCIKAVRGQGAGNAALKVWEVPKLLEQEEP